MGNGKTRPEVQEKLRKAEFASRSVTRIWQEEAAPDNPYLAQTCRCHGYDLLDLAGRCGLPETLYLLFQGELPSVHQARLLEMMMVAFINPGPRHPATRAAMNAGVGRTLGEHILPVALTVMGGARLGAGSVEAAMRFFRQRQNDEPGKVADEALAAGPPEEGDWHILPGFGSSYGGRDPMAASIADLLASQPAAGPALAWGKELASALVPHNMGWLSPGVAAAAFCDLGFLPRLGAGLFQLLSAPGLLAHGVEMANKPMTAMPFLDDEHYIIDPECKKRHD